MSVSLGEFELISVIRKEFPAFKESPKHVGIGDDAAVIEGNMMITTDAMVDGVHFLSDKISFTDLGYKAMAVNASDLAAMGGYPEYALLTLGLTGLETPGQITDLIEGFKQARVNFPFELIGGDTVKSKTMFLSITMLGKPFGAPVYRKGAKEGDFIYVTGTLGDSFLGLSVIEDTQKYPLLDTEYFENRHNRPSPRIGAVRWLEQNALLHACIDVSDGFLADLSHIAEESGTGFFMDAGELPLSKKQIGASYDQDPFYYAGAALSGGEDYELILVTPRQIETADFLRDTGIPVTPVGYMTGGKSSVHYHGRELDLKKMKKGFQHF